MFPRLVGCALFAIAVLASCSTPGGCSVVPVESLPPPPPELARARPTPSPKPTASPFEICGIIFSHSPLPTLPPPPSPTPSPTSH